VSPAGCATNPSLIGGTAGCTTQACGFRDIYPSFTEHDFTVYCLSHDEPEAQKKWRLKVQYATSTTKRHKPFIATQKDFPYPLLSDPDRVLIAALGAKNTQGKTKRGHFIFAKGGKLVERKLPVSPGDRYVILLSRVHFLMYVY
jgi:peroxiredoxin Q/BCP